MIKRMMLVCMMLMACGGSTDALRVVKLKLPADCTRIYDPSNDAITLACSASCPKGGTCAYVYDSEGGCAVFECDTKPEAIPGCTWETWTNGGGFVCNE